MKLQFHPNQQFPLDAVADLCATRNSSHLAGDSSHLRGDSSHLEEIDDELRTLAAPIAAKGKAPAARVRSVIAEMCRGRFMTTESLAHLLNRNAEGLRNKYLTPMVREGILHLRYPETPNRPDQAYTSTGVDT